MMRQVKIGILACMLVCILCAGNTLAYTAYSFGTDYGDGVNTRAAAQYVDGKLDNIGYTSNYVEDASGSTGYYDLPNAQVWFFNGHGNAGLAGFKSGGTWSYVTGTYSSTNFYPISGWSGGYLNDLALNVFVACYTGNTDGMYGNLLDASTQNGVDTAVGFSGLIDAAKSDY